MKFKKSQIHMMETIMVLLIFFILVLIGFVFYVRVMKGNIEIEQEEARQLKSIEVAQRALFLPEVQCSQGEEIITSDCVDLLMLEALTDPDMNIIGENQLYYHDRLGFSKIVIKEIYPDPNKPPLILYDKPLPADEFKDKITTNLPVSLKEPREDAYHFGIMQVDVYMK